MLYNPQDTWRYAIYNDEGIVDGVLLGFSTEVPHEEAQARLLGQVEEQSGQRYIAAWTQDKPHWWSAEVITSP